MLTINNNVLRGGSPLPQSAEERAILTIRQLNVRNLAEHLTHIYPTEFNIDIDRLNEAIEVLQRAEDLIATGKEDSDEESINLICEHIELGCEMFEIYLEESKKRPY